MPEMRQHPRKSMPWAVAFQVAEGPRVEATCRDLSLGGMFVETASPAPFGARVRLYLTLPGLKKESQIDAVVRWTHAEGMGVQFGLLGARETFALTQLLASAS